MGTSVEDVHERNGVDVGLLGAGEVGNVMLAKISG
jgi:predicted homoserine dehydrogenase-like protein